MHNLLKISLYGLWIACLAGVIAVTSMPTGAETIDRQRKMFLQAKKELRAKRTTSFKRLAKQLKDYPLYPYLIHAYLSSRLWQIKDQDIINFLKSYGDLPMANDLRRSWLQYLAKGGRWQTYVDNYTPQQDEVLQCYHLIARMQTNNHAYLLEDTRTLWLFGKSRPPQCDPAFNLLYQSDLMTSDLIWQRIELAMNEGNTSLAKYLSRRLDETDQKWVSRWIATHHNPFKWTYKPRYRDFPVSRKILMHGINRLATKDVGKAISRWDYIKAAYQYDQDQINSVERHLAVKAAKQKHAKAGELLDKLDNSLVDEDIFYWRLSTALKDKNWQRLLKWTEGTPPKDIAQQQWIYWRARALEESADVNAGKTMLESILKERDYYGFRAADRLGVKYDMNHHTLPEDLETWQEISQRPAILRARELYLLGMVYSARREWHHAFKDMTSYQLQVAAAIASNWGWHDRAILTMGKAHAYDDLILRFPLPYEKEITKYANKYDLNLSWVYALTRAESVFMEDARSPSGALGLMQVMPVTGRETAKAIGLNNFRTEHLLNANTNIPIGTAYLKKMYQRFNNNMILATAAYNAGPSNVSNWLPEQDCVEPDIWVEMIPFKETRGYVRRILYFASIYDWRLQKEITPIEKRTAMVTPAQQQRLAGLTCAGQMVSLK